MTVQLTINTKPENQERIELNARKTLDNDIMIFDHNLIDIVILTNKNKILTTPKDLINDEVYEAQARFFDFLKNKGVVVLDSVQGGNIYGAIEATYTTSKEYGHPIKHILYTISEFIREERPASEYIEKYKDSIKRRYTDPSVDKSTELGEIPHGPDKGALRNVTTPYGGYYRAYEE